MEAYKVYLLLEAMFPNKSVKYIVTNTFVGTRKMSEAITALALREAKSNCGE